MRSEYRPILILMGAGDNSERSPYSALAAILGSAQSSSPAAWVPSAFPALAGIQPTPAPIQPQAALAPKTPPAHIGWVHLIRRFDLLIDAIGITEEEMSDGMKKAMRVVGSLNRAYWNVSSQTDHAFLLGSWAKQTRVRPFSDIDILFVLPWSEYHRFNKHIGNQQSNLLQDLKASLGVTYSRTEIWGDRHVVAAEVDGVEIEVVPAFSFEGGPNDGQFWVCDTKDGGRYKLADPSAELRALEQADGTYNGNARRLLRLMKKWKVYTGAPIKSFQLERLVMEFLPSYQYSKQNRFYYDWLVRDFFAFLISRADGWAQMPGTNEWIPFGSEWLAHARTAFANATSAASHEYANNDRAAGTSWQEIFGTAAPVTVS